MNIHYSYGRQPRIKFKVWGRDMSRHEMLSQKEANVRLVVGWDNPMQSFFFQRIDLTKDEDDDDRIDPWIGCIFDELPNIEDLLEHIVPYVQLSEDMIVTLQQDKFHGNAITPLQNRIQQLMKK